MPMLSWKSSFQKIPQIYPVNYKVIESCVNNGIQEFFNSALTLQDYESLIRDKYSKQVSVLIVSSSEVTTNLQNTGAHYC